MHGGTTGLEPTDSSSPVDPVWRRRHALGVFREAAQEAEWLGEHKLQREAEDAQARLVGEIAGDERRQQTLQLGRVDGEDPQAAREGQA